MGNWDNEGSGRGGSSGRGRGYNFKDGGSNDKSMINFDETPSNDDGFKPLKK